VKFAESLFGARQRSISLIDIISEDEGENIIKAKLRLLLFQNPERPNWRYD
jgi:hypothetical protein